MPISWDELHQIRSAVYGYMSNNVSVVVTVTGYPGANINPGEEFNVHVAVTNALANGIRLRNVQYHVTMNPAVEMQAHSSGVSREGGGAIVTYPNYLAGSTLHFNPSSANPADTLVPGNTDTLTIRCRAKSPVNPADLPLNGAISAFITADPDFDWLFAHGPNSPTGTAACNVV